MNRKINFLKFGMYLLSLWLLFILIIVNKINIEICLSCRFANTNEILKILENNILPLSCIIFLSISFIFYFYFKHLINGAKNGPYEIIDIEDKSSEHLVFLATYVIPLVGFSLDDIRQIINLYITLIILGAIYIRTNLFYANPTLSLLGFKIYSAKIHIEDKDKWVILIARDNFEINDGINIYQLDKKIFFAKNTIKVETNENN